jgi:hypothetical protein
MPSGRSTPTIDTTLRNSLTPRSRQSRWCWSGVDSEELEWSGEVASVVAECGGYVGFSCQVQDADGEVAEAGHGVGSVVVRVCEASSP